MPKCHVCGTDAGEDRLYCTQCTACERPEKSKSPLWIVLNAINFCPLFGIIGIIFACQADTCYQDGRYEDAKSKIKVSRIMFFFGLAVGSILFILHFTFSIG